MYAKLVRSFANKGFQKIHQSTYYQIQASRKFRIFFPNLVELYCEGALEKVCFFQASYLPPCVGLSFSMRNLDLLSFSPHRPQNLQGVIGIDTFSVNSLKNLVTLCDVKTLCRDFKKLSSEFDLIPEIPPTPFLRHGLKFWDIAIFLMTPDTLGPVIAL